MPKPFHLAWFLQGSSVQAWAEPFTGAIGRDWMSCDLFCDMARMLEAARFDYILIEDSSYVGESYGGSTEIYLKHGLAVPRQDPAITATMMAAATKRIGIVPTLYRSPSASVKVTKNEPRSGDSSARASRTSKSA